MNILVLGTGGREHALAWRLAKEADTKVYVHPGNGGTELAGFKNFGDLPLTPQRISARAQENDVELIVIGPETLLQEGYADFFRREGFKVVGPGISGARLETSKIFAKEFMVRAGVPTAPFEVFDRESELLNFKPKQWPAVLKYDGIAAGKGVVLAQSSAEIKEFAKRIYKDMEFGAGPHRVLVEDCLPGKELSYIGLCDGKEFVPLASATDFKRVGNSNTGANTGGMGAVSPSPLLTTELESKIHEKIVQPVLSQMQRDRIDFRGVLYIGLMISPKGDPIVLEFNTRFGDPETQAIMMRWEENVIPALMATAQSELTGLAPLKWRRETAVYVVAAAEGYPGKVTTGDMITGIHELNAETPIFFSGVKMQGGKTYTHGGRVLGVGAYGTDVEGARKKAYGALEKITWRGRHFRTDIGLL